MLPSRLHGAASIARFVSLHVALVIGVSIAFAQTCPNGWSSDQFTPRRDLSGGINCVIEFDGADGAGQLLHIGGTFEFGGGYRVNRIARVRNNFAEPLGAGFDDSVFGLMAFDDGSGSRLYACGAFTHSGSSAVGHIARWNGTLWEPLAAGLDGPAYAMAVQNFGDGPKLYVGGLFETAGGVPASNLAAWDGESWSALPIGLSGGAVRSLLAVREGSVTSLIAGGAFSAAGALAVNRVARWTGSQWQAFGSGVGDNGTVFALHSFNDGTGAKIYAGGSFHQIGGVVANCIAQWNGTQWSQTAGGFGTGTSSAVYSLETYDSGSGPQLVAAGRRLSALGAPFAGGLLTLNGGTWRLVNSLTAPFVDFNQICLRHSANGLRLVAAGPTSDFELVRWDGFTLVSAISSTGQVRALVSQTGPSGDWLYLGGSFIATGHVRSPGLIRWNGTEFSALGSGLDGSVHALMWMPHPDGSGTDLIVGGCFLTAGGLNAPNVARWTAEGWAALGSGLPSCVDALTVWRNDDADELVAATDDGQHPVVRWNGTEWGPLGSMPSAYAMSLATFDDGSGEALYVGGWDYGSVPDTGFVRRWDGAGWTPLGQPFDNYVTLLAGFDDGSGPALYAFGAFQSAGDIPLSNVARWDGQQWNAVGLGLNGPASDACVHSIEGETRLVVCGTFTRAGGEPAAGIASWNGQAWEALATERIGSPYAVESFNDQRGQALFVGGDVFELDGVLINMLARYGRPPAIVGDIDDNCAVNITDLALLLRAYSSCTGDASYDATSDLDHDGCITLTDLATLLVSFGLSS